MLGTDQLEVWFFTGSQDLYGDETLRQVAEHSQRIVATLNDSGDIDLPIVWKPVLKTAEAIRAACLDATTSPNCAGVITWMHTPRRKGERCKAGALDFTFSLPRPFRTS